MLNINLFAGPACGKTTTASGLFTTLKMLHYKVELVPEYAKELTYGHDNVKLSDQLCVLGEQHHRLFRLKDTVDIAVHDGTFLLGLMYVNEQQHYNESFKSNFEKLVVDLFNSYDNLNIFLRRNPNLEFQQYGRRQNFEESKILDDKSYSLLTKHNIPFSTIDISENTIKNIVDLVQQKLNK